jgi:hypothetical protein
MAGTPVKRARRGAAAAAERDAERKRRARTPPPAPTPEQARERAEKAVEARRNAKTEITERDEANALRVLRKNMRSNDEKIAHAAAVKIVEYKKGKPATGEQEQQDTRIIYESAFVDPDHADAGAE